MNTDLETIARHLLTTKPPAVLEAEQFAASR